MRNALVERKTALNRVNMPVRYLTEEDIRKLTEGCKRERDQLLILLLYQTGTQEVMNDAIWECRLNFENIWGQKLVNAIKAIHKFIYSGKEIESIEDNNSLTGENIDTSEWFISKRQKEFRGEDEE